MATMTEIAKLAGVSRGTVDRVLNKRGGVSDETAERILQVAAHLHYTPNKAARQLSSEIQKQLLTFIMLNPNKMHFFQDVHDSVLRSANNVLEMGITVKIRYVDDWSAQALLEQLDGAVADGSSGIAVYGTDDETVVKKIREISNSGVLVVMVGCEIVDSGEIGYVGSNATHAGGTAAGLIHLIQCGDIRLGIILEYLNRASHEGRLAGLWDGFEKLGRSWHLAFEECCTDEFECFDTVKQQMQAHPETNTLFLSTSNVYGACRALERLNLPNPPRVVCYDNASGLPEMVQKGVVSAAIGQQPDQQGSEAVRMLIEGLALGMLPEQNKVYVEDKIFISENL